MNYIPINLNGTLKLSLCAAAHLCSMIYVLLNMTVKIMLSTPLVYFWVMVFGVNSAPETLFTAQELLDPHAIGFVSILLLLFYAALSTTGFIDLRFENIFSRYADGIYNDYKKTQWKRAKNNAPR